MCACDSTTVNISWVEKKHSTRWMNSHTMDDMLRIIRIWLEIVNLLLFCCFLLIWNGTNWLCKKTTMSHCSFDLRFKFSNFDWYNFQIWYGKKLIGLIFLSHFHEHRKYIRRNVLFFLFMSWCTNIAMISKFNGMAKKNTAKMRNDFGEKAAENKDIFVNEQKADELKQIEAKAEKSVVVIDYVNQRFGRISPVVYIYFVTWFSIYSFIFFCFINKSLIHCDYLNSRFQQFFFCLWRYRFFFILKR